MAVASSLFDSSPSTALPAATDWLSGTLLGSAATIVAVLAIAFIGVTFMMGRLALRDGLRVVIGCFVLFGAPVIVAGLQTPLAYSEPEPFLIEMPPQQPSQPPANYDPYAGASLRR